MRWLLSVNRKGVSWRPVMWGLGLQLVLGAIVLTPALQDFFFTVVDGGVRRLLSFAEAGSDFVFQSVEAHRIDVVTDDGVSTLTVVGHISPPLRTVAFWILPSIIFFSSLMAILYHLRVMQPIIEGIGKLMQRTMGTSAAESLSAAANIFIGQTEAPLVIRPYIAGMTRSELHAVMCGGFATVAGGVMAAYVGFLRDIPGIAGHLVTASILSAPAALAISKVLYPEDGHPETTGDAELARDTPYGNVIEAAARGATDGMKLAINVAAMLIAFVGLVALLDWVLTLVPIVFSAEGVAFGWAEAGVHEPLSLSRILGWLFFPVALIMGIAPADAAVVGRSAGRETRSHRVHRVRRSRRHRQFRRSGDQPALGHYCELRPLRFRELRLHRHPTRWHRRHRSGASARSEPPRPARHDRRLHRGLHDRRGCGCLPELTREGSIAHIPRQHPGNPARAFKRPPAPEMATTLARTETVKAECRASHLYVFRT